MFYSNIFMPCILNCILELLYTCVHLRSLLRSERALRSQNVRLAFTVHFHSELHIERIGLCESQQNEKRTRA